MKSAYVLCFLALLISPAAGAESAPSSKPAKSKPATGKPADAQGLIEAAYQANKDNPAYFVGSANYLWALSKKQSTSSSPAGPGEATLMDPATGKPIGSVRLADPALQRKAVALLTEAHSRFPYRLDIGTDLAYLLRETNEQSRSCSTLIDILNYAPKNVAKLQWKDGRPLTMAPGNFIPEIMQKYAAEFRKDNTKEGYDLCRKLCEKTIQAYPESPVGYSMLAGYYNARNDKKSTIKYLHIAHQKAPKDVYLLVVIAGTYRAMGDTVNARKYFEEVIRVAPSQDLKTAATEALAKLR